ncbi:hypothetical protein [Streptomyces sp. NPDC088350]|uniref:hypothetical protein n=1 Tax=Streptomyces sp. NPDC088350 TaxID=3365854 RepID=UPI0037F92147
MGEGEERSELWKALQTLTQDRGIYRDDLLKLLGGELYPLRALLGISEDCDAIAARAILKERLRVMIPQLTVRSGRRGLPIDDGSKQFRLSVRALFNVLERPDLSQRDLTRRYEWLDSAAAGRFRIKQKSAERDLNHAISQIEQLILAGGYKPPAPSPSKIIHPKSITTNTATEALMRSNWATPEDDALAVLAFSNGKRNGVAWTCRVLFTDENGNYDALRGENATRTARKRGIKKGQMERARRELAMSGALAVAPGRFDIVDMGLQRIANPWGLNRKYKSRMADDIVIREFQRLCLDSGRLDLTGDWTDEAVQEHGEDIARRAGIIPLDGISCAVLLDGLRRATLDQLANVHPLALMSVSYAAGIMFKYGTTDERLSMAMWFLEIVATAKRRTARGDIHQHITQLLYDFREFGITSRETSTLANELAAHVPPLGGKPTFTGADLLAHSRLG